MPLKIEMPVGAVFEKRLAELIWENCPDLARQTAAGRLALAIDVQDKATVKEVTKKVVDDAAAQLVGPLVNAAIAQIEDSSNVEAIRVKVETAVNKAIAESESTMQQRASDTLHEALRKYWDTVLLQEIKRASRDLFGERDLTKLIRERLELLVTEYLQLQLEPHKHWEGRGALAAAEAELVTRVTDAVGKSGRHEPEIV